MEENLAVRKNIRLQGYDYSSAGLYYITICTHLRKNLLAHMVVGLPSVDSPEPMPYCRLRDAGEISQTELYELENRYNYIKIDKTIIMPNHIHTIIALWQDFSPCPTIMDVICAYKSITTKRYNKMLAISGKTLWQSRFHDHVIRNEEEYLRIWQYIDENPANWVEDKYYVKDNY